MKVWLYVIGGVIIFAIIYEIFTTITSRFKPKRLRYLTELDYLIIGFIANAERSNKLVYEEILVISWNELKVLDINKIVSFSDSVGLATVEYVFNNRKHNILLTNKNFNTRFSYINKRLLSNRYG